MLSVVIFTGIVVFIVGVFVKIISPESTAKDRFIETLEAQNEWILAELREKQRTILSLNRIILDYKIKTPE